MNIAIAGLGYVGLSLACLLSKHNKVTAIDIDARRVASINSGASPIRDPDIEPYLASMPETLIATTEAVVAYGKADCIIIATPTNYDDETHQFDTSTIEAVLDQIVSSGTSADVVIKSTIPVGYTTAISGRYPDLRIMFSPSSFEKAMHFMTTCIPLASSLASPVQKMLRMPNSSPSSSERVRSTRTPPLP